MLVNLLSKRNIINTLILILLSAAIIFFKLTPWTIPKKIIVLATFLPLVFLSFIITSFMDVPLGQEGLSAYFILFFSFITISPNQEFIPFLITLLIPYGFFIIINKFNSEKNINIIFFFNISLFFAIMGFIYPPVLLFSFFIVIIAFFSSQITKKIITIISAYLTVFYFGFIAEMILFHKKLPEIIKRLSNLHIITYSSQYNSQWIFFIILTFIAFIFFISQKNTLPLKMRKLYWVVITFILITFFANLLISPQPIFTLIYPISFLTSYLFYNLKTKNYIKNILLLALFSFAILLAFNLI